MKDYCKNPRNNNYLNLKNMTNSMALSVFCLSFVIIFLGACSKYKNIQINTLHGLSAEIPYWCTSWKDGCNIYCRTDLPTSYETVETEKACIQANIIYPKCADTDQDAIEACAPFRNNNDLNNNSR